MSKAWPLVKLGEVLEKSQNWINLDAQKEYKEVTVRLWGKGVTLRGVVTGSQIAGSRRLQVNSNQFILSRIDARNGAFGLIPNELDNAVVSNDFPVFDIHQNRLLPKYLHWLSKTKNFVESCKNVSEGTTNRVRLKEDKFIKIEIPLPPLAEQQRIVTKIERLAGKIEEAKKLRQRTKEEIESLIASTSASLFERKDGWKIMAVGDFCEPPQYGYTESATDQPIGPRFLRITDIQNGRVDWDTVPFCRCPEPDKYLLKPNDLVFARTGATTGKSFVISNCPAAIFASYLIRLRVRDTVSIEYLYNYFQSPSYWIQIADEKKGTGQPNLNGSKLEKLKVPVPPPLEQQRIVLKLDTLRAKANALTHIQSQTAAELDAMLPSILDKAFKGQL